jgi:hypothetical protein
MISIRFSTFLELYQKSNYKIGRNNNYFLYLFSFASFFHFLFLFFCDYIIIIFFKNIFFFNVGNNLKNVKGSNVFFEHGIVNECSEVYIVTKTTDLNTIKTITVDGEKYVQVFTHWRQIINMINKDFKFKNYSGKIYILVSKKINADTFKKSITKVLRYFF